MDGQLKEEQQRKKALEKELQNGEDAGRSYRIVTSKKMILGGRTNPSHRACAVQLIQTANLNRARLSKAYLRWFFENG